MAGEEALDHHRIRLLADGGLPPGALGRAWYEQLETEVTTIRAAVRPLKTTAVSILVQGEGWVVRGTLDGIMDQERIIARSGEFHAKNRIRAWVEHLVLCAAAQAGQPVPRRTLLIGTKAKTPVKRAGKAKVSTHPIEEVPDAIAWLNRWMQILRDARTRPLPFFPEAAVAWLDARSSQKGDPIAAAHKAFRSTEYHDGDDSDPYIALAFRGEDPVTEHRAEFEALAAALSPDLTLPDL
jgi:exodeoxyribonuclease V gamma subunit